MDIGARLKEARLEKGLSLDSLQETTKIQKRYLIAIEEGNFHILPGKFYARAFIKEYANAVGLDPDELMEEHKEEVPKTEEQEENEKIEYSRMERSRRESRAKTSMFSKYFPTVVTVFAVIGVLFAAWLIAQQVMSSDEAAPEGSSEPSEVIIDSGEDGEAREAPSEDAEEGNTAQEETEDHEEDASEASAELNVVETGTGQSPESTLELENAGDELTILLETDDHTWLDITDESGEVIFSDSFSAENSPEEIELSDVEQLHFNVGNTPALKITINGTEVEYPADQIHQKLTININ